MGWVDKAKAVGSYVTGGQSGAAEGALKGDFEGAAKSYATGGLYDIDQKFNDGRISKAVGGIANKINPFKKGGGPSISDPQRPGTVGFTRPEFTAPQIAQTAAPQAGQIGFTPTQVQANIPSQYRDVQSGLISQLQAQAAGTAPSLAEMQLRQGMEQQIAAQQAALASARGGATGQAGLARQAMQQGAAAQAQMNQQAAQARLAEQLQAQQALGQVAGQARGQDIQTGFGQAQLQQDYQALAGNLAAQQAGYQTQASIAGAQIGSAESIAQARLAGDYNQMQIQMADLEMRAAQGDRAAMLEYERLRQTGELAQIQAATANAAQNKQLIGGLLSTAGTIGGAFIGGPAGAAAGGAAGNAVGGMVADSQTPAAPATASAGPQGGTVSGGGLVRQENY